QELARCAQIEARYDATDESDGDYRRRMKLAPRGAIVGKCFEQFYDTTSVIVFSVLPPREHDGYMSMTIPIEVWFTAASEVRAELARIDTKNWTALALKSIEPTPLFHILWGTGVYINKPDYPTALQIRDKIYDFAKCDHMTGGVEYIKEQLVK